MYEVLFQNSFLTLKALNLMVALGFLFGGIFCIRYVEKHKLNPSFLTKYFIYFLLTGLLGGRLFHILENFSAYQQFPMMSLYIWDLNLSLFGILFAFVITVFVLTKRSREDFWAWIDVCFLTSLAVMIFVHFGYFLSGKDYGIPTGLPWGMVFEASHIPFTTPIHPTQIYGLILAVLLLGYGVARSKRIHLSGVVGTRVMMIYALGMLAVDFLHGIPSLYDKISYGVIAVLCFVATVHCGHKTHLNEQENIRT